ncbi:hypothetical protein NZL82_01725 [Sphingomonas sanguinis]|uniref:hypothetical protein n=1 Tax=Sphingomonas sp. LC-1 TaxID=3110957 RepID=UPI0021BB787E|nr:hypothetical protein [Sphingomonas sp. LC-1]MCT8000591.1 hypothetical protein [Sphingomonas sp. LC-1]
MIEEDRWEENNLFGGHSFEGVDMDALRMGHSGYTYFAGGDVIAIIIEPVPFDESGPKAKVIERRSPTSHWQAWCSISEALPFIARALGSSANEESKRTTIDALSRYLDTLALLRFAATLG